MFTGTDSVRGSVAAMDHFNRWLDKALVKSGRTDEAKISYVSGLPIGPGKRWLKRGFVSHVDRRLADRRGPPVCVGNTDGFYGAVWIPRWREPDHG